jgi:hypothetical protein
MLFVFTVEVLEKERIERERIGAEQQQQLINIITNVFNVNLPKTVEKVSQKQLKGLFTNLTKSISQTIENALTKHLENFKKSIPQVHFSLYPVQTLLLPHSTSTHKYKQTNTNTGIIINFIHFVRFTFVYIISIN